MNAQSFTHNTERQRGGVHRTPVHHVHSLVPGGAAAQAYAGDNNPQAFVGTWGSISIDTINQLLRIHDDITPGGVLAAPLFSPAAIVAPQWPFMPLTWMNVQLTAGQPMSLNTGFNRYSNIVVIDAATGQHVVVDITQPDMNNFTLLSSMNTVVNVMAM